MVSHEPETAVIDSRPFMGAADYRYFYMGARNVGSNPALLIAVLNRTDTSSENWGFESPRWPSGRWRSWCTATFRSYRLPAFHSHDGSLPHVGLTVLLNRVTSTSDRKLSVRVRLRLRKQVYGVIGNILNALFVSRQSSPSLAS